MGYVINAFFCALLFVSLSKIHYLCTPKTLETNEKEYT